MKSARLAGKLLVASDARGRIVAATHLVETGDVHSGLEALDGQTVHELEIPPELASLGSPHAMLAALADARVTPGGTLRLKKLRREK